MNQTDAGDMVRGLIAALETRSWDDFAGYMDDSTIVIADHQDGFRHFVPWPEVRDEWQRAFAAPRTSRRSVRDIEAVIEPAGSNAFVSFGLHQGRSARKRALILGRLGDRWTVRHVYLSRLPPGTPFPVTKQRAPAAVKPVPAPTEDLNSQPVFAALLAVALVAVARLGILNEGEVNVETVAAIAAVFLGAVATLHRDLGPWFRGAETGAVADLPLAFSGALVVLVGAAFLVS